MILYVINSLSFSQATIVLGLSFFSQAIFDFPTGVLSDHLGQKRVLITSYVSYTAALFTISLAHSFVLFAFGYMIFGFASSQESGALRTWFDNKYSLLEFPEKNHEFSVAIAKVEMAKGIAGACSMVIGGLLAVTFSRVLVFRIQAVLAMLMALAFMKYLEASKTTETATHLSTKFIEIYEFLRTHLNVTLFILGTTLMYSSYTVWTEIVSREIYFSYTGNDLGASVFRFCSWFSIIVIMGRAGKFGSKLDRTKLRPIHLIHPLLFFGLSALIINYYPFPNHFSLGLILVFLLIFFLAGSLRAISFVLEQSFFLNEVPNGIRNSIYSLSPTLMYGLAFLIINIFGIIYDLWDISIAILILLVVEILAALLFGKSIQKQNLNSQNTNNP